MLDTFGWGERTQSKKWVPLTLETVLYFVSLDKETTKWPLQMLETACEGESPDRVQGVYHRKYFCSCKFSYSFFTYDFSFCEYKIVLLEKKKKSK